MTEKIVACQSRVLVLLLFVHRNSIESICMRIFIKQSAERSPKSSLTHTRAGQEDWSCKRDTWRRCLLTPILQSWDSFKPFSKAVSRIVSPSFTSSVEEPPALQQQLYSVNSDQEQYIQLHAVLNHHDLAECRNRSLQSGLRAYACNLTILRSFNIHSWSKPREERAGHKDTLLSIHAGVSVSQK